MLKVLTTNISLPLSYGSEECVSGFPIKTFTYPKPVPFFNGFVTKFLPEDAKGFLSTAFGLKASTGPENVP